MTQFVLTGKELFNGVLELGHMGLEDCAHLFLDVMLVG